MFTTLGGQARGYIGRLHANGSVDATFNPGTNGEVRALAVQADGQVVVGGSFTTLGGQPRARIGRLNTDGSVDATFNPGANSAVHALAVQADGKVVVGGQFLTLGGQARANIGRLSSPTAALQNLQVDDSGTLVTWERSGSSPEVRRVTVEQSLDGVTWLALGAATRVGGGWQQLLWGMPAGLSVYVRARGFAGHGGESVYESVRLVFLSTDVTTSVIGFASSAGAGSVVSGNVSYGNPGVAAAFGAVYELTLRAGLSGVSFGCINGVTASYASGTGVVTFSGAPAILRSGHGFWCTVSYLAPSGGQVVVASRIRTTVYQGANQAPDSGQATTEIRPTIVINNVSTTEGNSGPKAFTFTMTLSGAAVVPVTVTYATANGSAVAGSDYTAVPATVLTFTPGQVSKTVTVNVTGDAIVEPNETFAVNLSGATNASIADSQGVGTITNDDATALRISDVSAVEGNTGTKTFTFTVTLSNPSATNVTVRYATANGTAVAGTDYTAVPLTTLTFTPGQVSRTVAVVVKGDLLVEPAETFTVALSTPVGATIADGVGLGTITNDD